MHVIRQGNSNVAVLYLQYNNSVYERTFLFRFSSSIKNGSLTNKEMLLDSHSTSAGRGHTKYTSCKVRKSFDYESDILASTDIYRPISKVPAVTCVHLNSTK